MGEHLVIRNATRSLLQLVSQACLVLIDEFATFVILPREAVTLDFHSTRGCLTLRRNWNRISVVLIALLCY